jgi:hypothetical protein
MTGQERGTKGERQNRQALKTVKPSASAKREE